jgi:hypothetical protein
MPMSIGSLALTILENIPRGPAKAARRERKDVLLKFFL